MQDLTPKQLKKLERLAKIADKGEVAYVEEFDAISDQLEALDTKIEGVLSVAEEAKNREVKDYVLTDKDKKEIARSIEVPVAERIIEKTEVIRETPFVTKQVFETKIENEDTGEEIVGKINSQDTLIKSNLVEGFDLLKSKIPTTGWGAHPLRIEASGVMKTKVARTLNFIGPTVVQKGSGVTDITVSSVTLGTDNQIPYTNAAGTDFDYSPDFTFDGDIFNIGNSAYAVGAGEMYLENTNLILDGGTIDVGTGAFTVSATGAATALSYTKTGGTSSQFLKADGSVDSSAYITPSALATYLQHNVGRASGTTLIGGTGTTDDLILRTTSGVGATGADMIFQGGNNGATEFGRFLNSGDFSVGSNAIYVNAASKFLGINTATHESYHLRIVTTSTQGLKMTRTSPFTGSEFRVDLSGSGAEVVATGSGGTSVIRGFVSGATQAYISAGHLAVGATAGSARIHSTWTGGAQFRAEYNASNYWTLTDNYVGAVTYNATGSAPRHTLSLNSSTTIDLAPNALTFYGSSPRIEMADQAGSYGLLISAGYSAFGKAGIYEIGTQSPIADYDYLGGVFNYAAGNLLYDTSTAILYSAVTFNTPDVQTTTITATGNAIMNANVQMTGLTTGAGAPATILTNFNLYVDTATGIVYVD